MTTPFTDREVEAIRAGTPGCTDGLIHLNHAGSSFPSTVVLDAQIGHLRREATIGGYEAAELYARLEEFRVPYGPVNSIADIFADPHIADRGDLVQIEDPHVGAVTVPAPYPRLSHAAGRIYSPAPGIGEHNAEVYGGILGMSEGEMGELSAAGVI